MHGWKRAITLARSPSGCGEAEAASDVTLRVTTPADRAAILALYPLAFPAEDLTPLVNDLLTGGFDVLSLGAFDGDACVGHVLLSRGDTDADGHGGALLGPLAVHPDRQRTGWGRRLVQAACDRRSRDGVRRIFVLGDPAYDERFGFLPQENVQPPYPLPADWSGAWQSLRLNHSGRLTPGPLRLPNPWMTRALWAP